MVSAMLWAAALMGAPPTESDAARAKAAVCVARAKCAPPVAVEAKPSQLVYREVWHTDARGRLVRELVPCSDGTCAK